MPLCAHANRWSTPSGVSYERDALRDWITKHQEDPIITKSPLQWSQCVRNETLEKILPKMMRMHQTLAESSCVKDREGSSSMASNGAQQSKPSENDRRNLEKLLSLLTHSDDSHGFVPNGHELVLVRLLFGLCLCLCLWRLWSLCSRALCMQNLHLLAPFVASFSWQSRFWACLTQCSGASTMAESPGYSIGFGDSAHEQS